MRHGPITGWAKQRRKGRAVSLANKMKRVGSCRLVACTNAPGVKFARSLGWAFWKCPGVCPTRGQEMDGAVRGCGNTEEGQGRRLRGKGLV